jgi:DNA-binding NtrC family response regulator
MLSNVLVIDDDVATRDLLSAVLNDAGYLVEVAENGKEAINKCKKRPFDVALIDIVLPDIEGIELFNALKHIRPKMVKIIITGYPSIESAVRSVNEKADGYLLKPINIEELLAMIKKILGEKANEYIEMLKTVEHVKEATPVFKYQRPNHW